MTTATKETPRIVDEKTAFAVLELSIRTNTPHTKHSEALRNLYTEMLLAGCGPYDRQEFLDALLNLGIKINIFDDADMIRLQFRARNEVLQKGLALLALIFEKPQFKAKELARIKKRTCDELKLAKEDAEARATQHFVNAFVQTEDHRYEHDLDVVRTETEKVTLAEIRAFHIRTVRKSPIYAAVGGTRKSCDMMVNALAHITTSSKAVPDKPVFVRQFKSRTVTLVDIPHKQNIEFSIGGSLPFFRTDPDFAAFYIGIRVLGLPGFAGRLMDTVRKKEGLTYNIYAYLAGPTGREQGFWHIDTFFTAQASIQGITSTLREVERMHKHGITEDELRRFKQIIETRFAIVNDSLIQRVKEQHARIVNGLSLEAIETFKNDIATITRTRVNAALKKYLNPAHVVISGAGPVRSVEGELKKFATRESLSE